MLCHIIGHDSGSLPPALPSERPATISQALENIGAGEGNRTLVISLEGCRSTIELHPHGPHTLRALAAPGQERCERFSSETRAGMRRLVRFADARPAFAFGLRRGSPRSLRRANLSGLAEPSLATRARAGGG